MNHLGAGTLSALVLASITTDVATLIGDTGTSTEVTFVETGARGYDPGRGQATYADTSTVVDAWVSDVVLDDKAIAQGAQVGDVQILIAAADLDSTPATNSRCRIGSHLYTIYRAVSGPLATHHHLFAHRTD